MWPFSQRSPDVRAWCINVWEGLKKQYHNGWCVCISQVYIYIWLHVLIAGAGGRTGQANPSKCHSSSKAANDHITCACVCVCLQADGQAKQTLADATAAREINPSTFSCHQEPPLGAGTSGRAGQGSNKGRELPK